MDASYVERNDGRAKKKTTKTTIAAALFARGAVGQQPCATVEVTSATGGSVHGHDSTGFVLARNRQPHLPPSPHHQRPRQRHRLHDQLRQHTGATTTAAATTPPPPPPPPPTATTTTTAFASSASPSSSSTSLATERLITFGKIRRYRETSAASPSSRTSPSAQSLLMMMMATATKGKRPLRHLTATDKIDAIQRIHDGESKASVARDIGVPESTLRGWCKNEEKLRYMSRQSVENAEKLSNEATAAALTAAAAAELFSGPPEKRLKLESAMFGGNGKLKYDDSFYKVAAAARGSLNGLDLSGGGGGGGGGGAGSGVDKSGPLGVSGGDIIMNGLAGASPADFSQFAKTAAEMSALSKSKAYGAELGKHHHHGGDPSKADHHLSMAAISPLTSLSHLSGMSGLGQSPLALSFNDIATNLNLIAQLNNNHSLATMSSLAGGLNTAAAAAAAAQSLRNVRPKGSGSSAANNNGGTGGGNGRGSNLQDSSNGGGGGGTGGSANGTGNGGTDKSSAGGSTGPAVVPDSKQALREQQQQQAAQQAAIAAALHHHNNNNNSLSQQNQNSGASGQKGGAAATAASLTAAYENILYSQLTKGSSAVDTLNNNHHHHLNHHLSAHLKDEPMDLNIMGGAANDGDSKPEDLSNHHAGSGKAGNGDERRSRYHPHPNSPSRPSSASSVASSAMSAHGSREGGGERLLRPVRTSEERANDDELAAALDDGEEREAKSSVTAVVEATSTDACGGLNGVEEHDQEEMEEEEDDDEERAARIADGPRETADDEPDQGKVTPAPEDERKRAGLKRRRCSSTDAKEALDNILFSGNSNDRCSTTSSAAPSPPPPLLAMVVRGGSISPTTGTALTELNGGGDELTRLDAKGEATTTGAEDAKSETSEDSNHGQQTVAVADIRNSAEAVEHGEKFLKWLEACSDPNVTAMQVMQFKYLLNSIKLSAERQLQTATAGSALAGAGTEERTRIRKRK
uniref:Protein distal antenna n=1 Tax=Anopheles coluzzii TaxID=1518534 RepID=A0A8W7PRI9_ANOCL